MSVSGELPIKFTIHEIEHNLRKIETSLDEGETVDFEIVKIFENAIGGLIQQKGAAEYENEIAELSDKLTSLAKRIEGKAIKAFSSSRPMESSRGAAIKASEYDKKIAEIELRVAKLSGKLDKDQNVSEQDVNKLDSYIKLLVDDMGRVGSQHSNDKKIRENRIDKILESFIIQRGRFEAIRKNVEPQVAQFHHKAASIQVNDYRKRIGAVEKPFKDFLHLVSTEKEVDEEIVKKLGSDIQDLINDMQRVAYGPKDRQEADKKIIEKLLVSFTLLCDKAKIKKRE